MSSTVRILIPLPECKAPGGREGVTLQTRRGALRSKHRVIWRHRTQAVTAFRSAMGGAAPALKVLNLAGRPFDEALRINRDFERSPLARAIDRHPPAFTEALAWADLDADGRRRLESQLLLLCPLLGLVGPADPVPDFRCPVGARLPGVGSLHKFWKDPVTSTLNRLCREKLVVSFLPVRLSALWEPDGKAAQLVTVHFLRDEKQGTRGETAAVPALTAEALRYIAERDVRTVAGLTAFRSSADHTYSAAHSETVGGIRHLCFVR